MSPNLDAIRERHQRDRAILGRSSQQPIEDIGALLELLDKRHAKTSELRASIAMLAAGWRAGAKYYQDSPEQARAVTTCADQIDVLLEMTK